MRVGCGSGSDVLSVTRELGFGERRWWVGRFDSSNTQGALRTLLTHCPPPIEQSKSNEWLRAQLSRTYESQAEEAFPVIIRPQELFVGLLYEIIKISLEVT